MSKGRGLTAGLLFGIFASLAPALAQESRTSEPGRAGKTVDEAEVHTWTLDGAKGRHEALPATPTYEGTTGLFHLPSAYTLPKGKPSLGLFRDNLDRDPKDVDVSIHGVSLAYGITDSLEAYGNFGIQNRIDADALQQPGFVNDYPFVNSAWQTGVGDLKLGLKYAFSNDLRGAPLALALRGFAKLPTADETKGLGTGKPSYGVDLLLSRSVSNLLALHGSAGYQFNQDPDTPSAVDLSNAFKWGFGFNLPTTRVVQLQAEATGAVYQGDELDHTNPIDLVVGPVVWIKPGLFVRAAVSWNLNFDDRGLGSGSASWTGRHFSIGYHPGVEGRAVAYAWSASAGSVSGTQASARYDSSGVAPGTDVQVTVQVSDGRGGQASAACQVAVKGPEKQPVPISCISSGFPRNSSRLNNVDKACLDDVAARLRQDPSSRLVIVGHADIHERHGEILCRTRAEAAKAYLTGERGVDVQRVGVRTAPVAPATLGAPPAELARNRRVEVFFLPAGAVLPEAH